MPAGEQRRDVIVVGGGASGCWAAAELAPDHDVLLLEAGAVGGGASGHAAGFVSIFEGWAPYPDAIVHSLQAYRALDGTHGFEFVERPYVELLKDDAEIETFRRTYAACLDESNYEIAYLDAAEIEERWPGAFDLADFVGGVLKADSGIIDPQSYVNAVATEARDRGAEIRTQTPVDRLLVENGAVVGVATTDETYEADVVVCAAGAQTKRLVAPYLDLPMRPFIYSNIRVSVDAPLRPDYPMMYGDDVWWRPEPRLDGTLLISGGEYFLPVDGRPPRSPPVEFLEEVEEKLPRMVRAIDQVEFVTGSGHTCPNGTGITPDGRAIIDAPEHGPDGLVIAGPVNAGISASPFTGAAVRSLVTGDTPPVSLSPFALDRFGDVPTEFEIHGIQEMPTEFQSGEY